MDDVTLTIEPLPSNNFSVNNSYKKIEYTSSLVRKNMRKNQIIHKLKANVTFLNFVKANCDDDDDDIMIDNMIIGLYIEHITNWNS